MAKIDLRKYYNGRPKFSWAEDMVKYEYVQPHYLVKPIIPPATWGVLYGFPEAGKTQLALSLAINIIEGSYFLSRFKCQKGKVGLIEIDTENHLVTQRLQFIERLNSLGERAFGIAHYDTDIDIFEMMKQAKKDPDVFDWLTPMIENKFDLIIIDSLNKTHNLDEWSNTTPKRVYNAFRSLIGSGPTLLFIHHARKESANPTISHTDDIHDARGSSALKGDSNFMIKLWKRKKGEERVMKIIKAKGAPESVKAEMSLMFNPKTLLFQPSDPAFARAFALVDVGLEKSEVVKQLVAEDACSQSKAYDLFTKATEIIEEAKTDV